VQLVYDSDLNSNVAVDDDGAIRQINPIEPQLSDQPTPRLAAIDYLNTIAPTLGVPTEQLAGAHQSLSYMDPQEQGAEYRVSAEKQLFDSTTVAFEQTYHNVPVWRAGITVVVQQNPNRVVSATNTSQPEVRAELPSEDVLERYRGLFRQATASAAVRLAEPNGQSPEPEGAAFVRGLIDTGRAGLDAGDEEPNGDVRLLRGRFYLYRYQAEERVARRVELPPGADTDVEQEPGYTLPLPPVPEQIEDGRYYLVSEVTFTYPTAEYGVLTWLALVEANTGVVVYLRALAAQVNGLVYRHDPVSVSGNAANTAAQTGGVLDTFRTSESLPNLNGPLGGTQFLAGTRASVSEVEAPPVLAPTNPNLVNFDYSARTNDFAAVNAYYHTDRFFSLVESLGFPLATYFDGTSFPIPIDHRGLGNAINAHCVGNGMGGIGHCCYALADATDTVNPIGIACDWRVHLHELGGHGVLYEHVNFANFGFSHSAGDSIAVIMNDPESIAPDRFLLAPFVSSIVRRHDRPVGSGWAWGGVNDVGSYSSEQILSTTMFRIYRSLGGDSSQLARRRFAARATTYLILRAIGTLTPATNPSTALLFANALLGVELLNWTSEGVFGGAYRKVIRWSFERQGLYQPAGAPTPVTTPGAPPAVDVYIDDGRAGHYQFQPVHWNTTTIWNRQSPDGLTGHQEPTLGATNYAYVKIKNRGTQQASNVVVHGYHCKPSAGLLWPNDLQPMTTASIAVGTLGPNDSEEKVVGPFEWTPIINAYGHDCLLMIVSTASDPSNVVNFTAGETVPEWRLVPNDNNIGQRNVYPVPGGGLKGLLAAFRHIGFWVGNPYRRTAVMEIQVRLPELLAKRGWTLTFPKVGAKRFKLEAQTQVEVALHLKAGEEFSRRDVEKARDRDIEITVLADGGVVGGMTYRLDPSIDWPHNDKRNR
jgi:hypothetical protein